MKLFRTILILLTGLLGASAIFLAYTTIDDFDPETIILLGHSEEVPALAASDTLQLLIWNIGYAGLDASMDFFYDGGEQMRPERKQVEQNLEGILETLTPYRSYDFVLLQEVDRDSRRSYRTNQVELIEEQFPSFHSYFGMNYEVSFVPLPVENPMGKVSSGLLTLTDPLPMQVERHSFQGNYAWPMRPFMLDRCFLVSRYPVENGNQLLVVNTHNSAYDDGSLRARQMSDLKEFLLAEYEAGNYVIVGGDWNQTPFGMEPRLPGFRFDTVDLTYIEAYYPAPDWNWAYDRSLPTNRRVSVPYDRETSLTTVIDFYLVSPNIRVERIRTADTGFRFSDHQPVELTVRLLPSTPIHKDTSEEPR